MMIELNVYDFDVVIKNFSVEVAVDNEVDYLRKHLVGMSLVITDSADADGRQLPDVIIIDFSNSYIETTTDPAGNGLQYLALTLKRHIFRQAKVDPGYTYVHDIKKGLPFLLIYHPHPTESN